MHVCTYIHTCINICMCVCVRVVCACARVPSCVTCIHTCIYMYMSVCACGVCLRTRAFMRMCACACACGCVGMRACVRACVLVCTNPIPGPWTRQRFSYLHCRWKRFVDRGFSEAFSLRRLIFHLSNNLAWDDWENSTVTCSRMTKMTVAAEDLRSGHLAKRHQWKRNHCRVHSQGSGQTLGGNGGGASGGADPGGEMSESQQLRMALAISSVSYRRIYRGDFTECISGVISALGYVPLWGNSKFYWRVRSLPGVNAKPLFGPNLDSTATERLITHTERAP